MGQQDVQELNRILFSALESSLVGTSGSSLIHRLYHGTLVNQITCKECGNISERQVRNDLFLHPAVQFVTTLNITSTKTVHIYIFMHHLKAE